ncbi:GntR family transcriptional regulator [Embleya sp. NBC_00896]|uniref:GntR family transcriptional regulator n=1 Tax=Embleya sp. NBC_00896 TaxID=2975961 RepID=UPI00386A3ADA
MFRRQRLPRRDREPGRGLSTGSAATAVNPNTTLKAYRELEREGLVEPRPGQGTFVLHTLAKPAGADDSPLRIELREWMERAHRAGLQREDVAALVSSVVAERYGPR